MFKFYQNLYFLATFLKKFLKKVKIAKNAHIALNQICEFGLFTESAQKWLSKISTLNVKLGKW